MYINVQTCLYNKLYNNNIKWRYKQNGKEIHLISDDYLSCLLN